MSVTMTSAPNGVHGTIWVRVDLEGVGDVRHQDSTQTFSPQTLLLEYSMNVNGGWGPARWRVFGPRRLKSGRLGKDVHENFGYGFSPERTPGWLRKAARYFTPPAVEVPDTGDSPIVLTDAEAYR